VVGWYLGPFLGLSLRVGSIVKLNFSSLAGSCRAVCRRSWAHKRRSEVSPLLQLANARTASLPTLELSSVAFMRLASAIMSCSLHLNVVSGNCIKGWPEARPFYESFTVVFFQRPLVQRVRPVSCSSEYARQCSLPALRGKKLAAHGSSQDQSDPHQLREQCWQQFWWSNFWHHSLSRVVNRHHSL
jgi:hypothetical protein